MARIGRGCQRSFQPQITQISAEVVAAAVSAAGPSSQALGTKRLYNSFQKNLARPTPDMSILREIDFGTPGVAIEQRTDRLDHVKADLRNIASAEPFQDSPALQRDWQVPQFFDRKIDIFVSRILCERLDPTFFFGCDHSCAPDVHPNIAAGAFLQIRKKPPANPVPQRREISVGSIFAKFQTLL